MRTHLKKAAGIVCALAAGFLLYLYVLPMVLHTSWAVAAKIGGRAEDCPWPQTVRFYPGMKAFDNVHSKTKAAAATVRRDEAAGLVQVAHPGLRPLWTPASSTDLPLVSYLAAEHDWMEQYNREFHVRRGDVVVDVGAHVGIFVAKSLSRGASKVIAIEPHPANVECLRRNFSREIQQGMVVVAPVAAWNQESTLDLHVASPYNSGGHSIAHDLGGNVIRVRSRPIDRILDELGIERVDMIKMDIEGAESKALEGAMETLRRHHPRLMLETNHEPDDARVLPAIVRRAYAGYQVACGPCRIFQPQRSKLIPQMVVLHE